MKIFTTIQIANDGISINETFILLYKNIFLLIGLIISSILLFYFQVSVYQKNIMYGKYNSYVQSKIDCSVSPDLNSIITDFNLNVQSMEFLKNINYINPCDSINNFKSILTSEQTYKIYNDDIIGSKFVDITSLDNFYNNKFFIKFQFKNENFLLVSEKQKEQQIQSVSVMLNDLIKKVNLIIVEKIYKIIKQTEYSVNIEISKNNLNLNEFEKSRDDKDNEFYLENLFQTKYKLIELKNFKESLINLENRYLSQTKSQQNLIFRLDEKSLQHISLLRENDRLNLFQKMSALELSIYFSFFISFVFILLLVLLNSFLNNKIVNDK